MLSLQLWENLVYDVDVKQRLLDYATSALLFAERGVNANIVSFNRWAGRQGLAYQRRSKGLLLRIIITQGSYLPLLGKLE